MKIDDFEYYVDSKILERGRKLFEKNCVIHYDSYGANWYFTVKGTKIYHTVVCLHKNGNINFESCNCPYSERYLCKHIVACLFYIRKELGIKRETMLSKFLQKNQELLEQADFTNIAKKFLQSIFKRIRKQGFIEYNYMPDFEIAIDEFLEYLNHNCQNCSKEEFLNACLFLLNTISKTKYNCDDSNGEITHSFYAVINFIKEHILEPNTTLFAKIFSEILNPKNEYDFEINELLELACQFAQTDIDKQKIKKHINSLIEQSDYSAHLTKIKEHYFN